MYTFLRALCSGHQFCKLYVTNSKPDQVVDFAKIIAALIQTNFSLSASPYKIFQTHLMDFLNRAEICENFLLRIHEDGFFVFSTSRF